MSQNKCRENLTITAFGGENIEHRVEEEIILI